MSLRASNGHLIVVPAFAGTTGLGFLVSLMVIDDTGLGEAQVRLL